MKGRPLRFLATVMASWVAARVVLLWPQSPGLPALIGAVAPPLAAAERPDGWSMPFARREDARLTPAPQPSLPPAAASVTGHPVAVAPVAPVGVGVGPEPVVDQVGTGEPAVEVAPRLPPPLVPTPPPVASGRLAGSLWGIARGGGAGTGTLPGGQLGASQAGARLTYALDHDRRIALATRVSAPLRGRGAEAALGVEWRPVDAPVRLIAEQRLALDGGRGGPTVLAVAGLPPTPVAGWTLEAYGQAGAIVRHRVAGFADGAARLTRPIGTRRLRPDLGIGSWGGAQPGAARLDVGPTIGVALPVGGQRVRLTADWRVRVAGRARPTTGPALSIGTDF